jgi:hypothetical protein
VVIEALRCPSCGAPAPLGGWPLAPCAFCGSTLAADTKDLASNAPKGAPRIDLGGRRYALLGLLARGERTDVFLGKRDARLTEMVVVKLLRDSEDAASLVTEWRAIEMLERSEIQGAEYFTTLLPQRVSHGRARTSLGVRLGSVFRWRSGFQHNLEDVRAAHPRGVDPRTGVWIWKRALELLGWVHRSRWVHGNLLPAHVLVHPRDHGVVFTGWGRAARSTETGADITAMARSVIHVLGGDPSRATLPFAVPEPLGVLLSQHADPQASDRSEDAWELLERVGAAGRAAYGPPAYHRLEMPGW